MALSRIWLFSPVFVLFTSQLPAAGQTQASQPPANYRGPDTYGMCAYVIGDTEYYTRSFYTSSYFKAKAEQEVRTYAQTQANGAVRSHCIWSYRESDLATMKETDRRLIGMPGHPAKAVESSWTFQGGTIGNAGAATAGSGTATASGGTASTQSGYARRTAVPSAGTYGAGSSSVTSTSVNTSATTSANGASASSGITSTAGSASGSVLGGAQQSLSDAKTNAMSTAAGGMTAATNTAVGALTNGMQNMFHRKQSAQQQVATTSAGGGQGGGAGQGSAVASPAGEGFGLADGATAAGGNAQAGGVEPNARSIEGLVADVAGKDVVINVGSQAGVRVGSSLLVTHAQRTINDPATGKPLRRVEAEVGELKITSVDAGSASGVFSGPGVPVVGDKVRTR